MASPRRRSPRDLNAELAQDASQFSFFQAVRLLGLSARKRDSRRAALPPRLRFRTLASLSFPPSELQSYRPPATAEESDTLAEMTQSFIGLTGPSGVLPTSYTELLLERRQQYKDDSLHAFLDLFSHRSAALFFAAWQKYRYWIRVEAGEEDDFSRNLLDLSGLGLQSLRQQLQGDNGIDENLFVYFAGLLSQKPLSGQALVALVEGFFGVSASLQQFVGQWMNIPQDEQSRLGGHACELGVSVLAGARVWDRQTRLQLRLGSMDRQRYDALQPGGQAAQALQALLKFAVGHNLAVDVCLVLQKQAVPPARLAADNALRLGGSCWLGAQQRDPDDMRYALLQ